jgi:hypothetical protein
MLVGMLLASLLGGSCESRSQWEGRYAGQAGENPALAVVLTLQSGGKGQWTADQESTPLRWEERSGALWLHLKTGGVMVAQFRPEERALTTELPGIGRLVLRKQSP